MLQDKACEEVEQEEEGKELSDYETDEEWEARRRVQQATMLKDEVCAFYYYF